MIFGLLATSALCLNSIKEIKCFIKTLTENVDVIDSNNGLGYHVAKSGNFRTSIKIYFDGSLSNFVVKFEALRYFAVEIA